MVSYSQLTKKLGINKRNKFYYYDKEIVNLILPHSVRTIKSPIIPAAYDNDEIYKLYNKIAKDILNNRTIHYIFCPYKVCNDIILIPTKKTRPWTEDLISKQIDVWGGVNSLLKLIKAHKQKYNMI